MSYNPIEAELDRQDSWRNEAFDYQNVICTIESIDAWIAWRHASTTKMFDEWGQIGDVDIRILMYSISLCMLFDIYIYIYIVVVGLMGS